MIEDTGNFECNRIESKDSGPNGRCRQKLAIKRIHLKDLGVNVLID